MECSQGRVKVPTGGKDRCLSPRAPVFNGVSRSGVNPEPTVIVRMEENKEQAECGHVCPRVDLMFLALSF